MQRITGILILFLLLPFTVQSQIVTEMELVNDKLARGENFQFTYSFFNGSDETLQYTGSSSWQVKLEFSDIEEFDVSVTADYLSYFVAPGGFLTFEFDLSPEELKWPLFDGEHLIYATFLGRTDSVAVEAPATYGGELNVRYNSTDAAAVQAFKDSLAAEDESMEILDQGDNSGEVFERWSFENLQVERLNQQVKADDRFISSWIDRFITHESSTFTSNEDESDILPASTELKRNYPNPFNPSTNIEFYLDSQGRVELSVYDLAGRKVAELVSRTLSVGTHSRQFDGGNLASGVYIYRLTTENTTLSKKLTLVK
ncbi:MAG: T9SS type A sorting domain-containing protein [Bacteroidetes bacterium]|jgi:hypothetical protein|nr:T9SS type A sorting domain-containing protein [Bacteroidota bacterium]